MTVGRRSGCFLNTTESDALTTVITRHSGLSADVTATTGQMEQLTQFAASDWDFLLARAEANGLVVNVVDGKVSVVAPDFSGTARLNVTYGFDLLEANLEEDARTQLASVACAAWDPATQALVNTTESAKNANTLGADTAAALAGVAGGQPFPLHTATPQAAADLKTWAGAQLLKSELAKIRGTVRFQGNAGLLPAQLLEISGLGDRFDGNAFVSGVVHEFSEGRWTTVATVGLDPAWFAARPDVSAPPAAALLPAVPGLQIGTVKQIQEDPGKQFRVLVNVPTVDSEGHALWARLARPYATNNAGCTPMTLLGDYHVNWAPPASPSSLNVYPGQVIGIRQVDNARLAGPGVVACNAEDRAGLSRLFAEHRFASVLDCAGNCALKQCEDIFGCAIAAFGR